MSAQRTQARGRPSKKTPEMAKEICTRRAAGESLRAICCDESMPNRETVRRWLLEDEEFCGQYAHATEIDADNEFDDLIALADECTDPGLVQLYKLRVDVRKWVLSKRLPKKYGDKVTQEITGQDDKLQRFTYFPPAPKTMEEFEAELAKLRERQEERRD